MSILHLTEVYVTYSNQGITQTVPVLVNGEIKTFDEKLINHICERFQDQHEVDAYCIDLIKLKSGMEIYRAFQAEPQANGFFGRFK